MCRGYEACGQNASVVAKYRETERASWQPAEDNLTPLLLLLSNIYCSEYHGQGAMPSRAVLTGPSSFIQEMPRHPGVPACWAPSEAKQRSRQAHMLTQDMSIKLNTQ